MLNGWSGSIATGVGLGAFRREPRRERRIGAPSSATRFDGQRFATLSSAAEARRRRTADAAPQSRTIIGELFGSRRWRERAGGSANAKRGDERRHILDGRRSADRDGSAIASTPSRCIAAAARSISASNCAKVSVRSPSIDRDMARALARHGRGSGPAWWRSRWSRSSSAGRHECRSCCSLAFEDGRAARMKCRAAFAEVFAVKADVDRRLRRVAQTMDRALHGLRALQPRMSSARLPRSSSTMSRTVLLKLVQRRRHG